jgi:hypothetical protein
MSSVTGTLGLFSLVDLFQLLAASSRTGRLEVDHPQGKARVYFDKGKVVHADFDHKVGEEAVFALFSDEKGSFEFVLGLPAPQRSIESSTDNLMLDAIRRVDEAKRDREVTASQITAPSSTSKTSISRSASNTVVPVFANNAPDAGGLTLNGNEVMVLRVIDGEKDIGKIARETDLEVPHVKEIVERLIQVGALEVRTKKPRTARLVALLAKDPPPNGTAVIDVNIMASWERLLGSMPEKIACRLPNGQVHTFFAQTNTDVGPYILFSRDTLFSTGLAANTALLVRPVTKP